MFVCVYGTCRFMGACNSAVKHPVIFQVPQTTHVSQFDDVDWGGNTTSEDQDAIGPTLTSAKVPRSVPPQLQGDHKWVCVCVWYWYVLLAVHFRTQTWAVLTPLRGIGPAH